MLEIVWGARSNACGARGERILLKIFVPILAQVNVHGGLDVYLHALVGESCLFALEVAS